MSQLRSKFIDLIHQQFPALSAARIEPLIGENLLSPFQIELPKNILSQAQEFVRAAFHLRSSPEYQAHHAPALSALGLKDPGNKSILMSYDFHIDAQGLLKLIEINTNAAFLGLGDLVYKLHGIPQPVADFSIDEIRANIEQELKLNGQTGNPAVVIIDENPESQRLFIEFLVFQEWFKTWGWSSEIRDFHQVESVKSNFIYNRFTDFYFTHPGSETLKKVFNSKRACISPNPVEYFYLADKTRMIEWTQIEFLQKMGLSEIDKSHLLAGLPKAWDLNPGNADELWSRRKTLFFKPKQAFGAKQSYKGASISHRIFHEITKQNFIAQEYVAAPEIERPVDSVVLKYKYDLRFYAYQDRVQSVIARIYQGQVTNLKTTHGGFACVKFQ